MNIHVNGRSLHQGDLVRSSTLIGYMDLVTALGGNAGALLRHFHVDPASLDRDEATLPYRTFIRILEYTAATLDCPEFGMRLAEEQGLNVVGPLAIIGLNSPTVGHALTSIFEHIEIYSPACLVAIDRTTDPQFPHITFDTTIKNEPQRRQSVELSVSLINRDIKTLTSGHFVAERILFRHATPLPPSVYRRYFGTQVLFEQDMNAVVVRPRVLEYKLDNVNSYLHDIVIDYVRYALADHPLDIGAQVTFMIRKLLSSGQFGLPHIAKYLCLNERTLQRRLQQSAQVFERIVDGVRRERAEELLKSSRLPMTQVAIQLGYTEQSSMNRACRRWFGKSPLQVRRTAQAVAGGTQRLISSTESAGS